MSDLSHFDPVWQDMQKTRAHLANMLEAMQSAGLIEGSPAPAFRPQAGGDLWAYSFGGRCSHLNAVPVALVLTGEVVARLCPDCDAQLPSAASGPDN